MSSSAGIADVVRRLAAVRHRVEAFQDASSRASSRKEKSAKHSVGTSSEATGSITGDGARSSMLTTLERLWNAYMHNNTLRFRDTGFEYLFTSIAQGIATIPSAERSAHASWRRVVSVVALKTVFFAGAFAVVQWIINPRIRALSSTNDTSDSVPVWVPLVAYGACLGCIAIYACIAYAHVRSSDKQPSKDEKEASASKQANPRIISPVASVLANLLVATPTRVPPFLSICAAASFSICPMIVELASNNMGALIMHVTLLSLWSSFYFMPLRFVDATIGAATGVLAYLLVVIGVRDGGLFSWQLFFQAIVVAIILFYSFAAQKYYRERAQRIQLFAIVQERALERDLKAVRNMKAHLITMQYPDFILRQQKRGEMAVQSTASVIVAQIRIFNPNEQVPSATAPTAAAPNLGLPASTQALSRGQVAHSAAAGVVPAPSSGYMLDKRTAEMTRALGGLPTSAEVGGVRDPQQVMPSSPTAAPVSDTEALVSEELRLLNHIFVAFDRLSKVHGVEKIKNVGQSWVGACGIDDDADVHGPNATSGQTAGAMAVLKFAVACMEKLSKMPTGNLQVKLSVGIGTETTVAGIFGSGIYQYEAVGDAVAEAHTLSSLSTDSILVAQSTLRWLGQGFFVSRFIFQEACPMPQVGSHHGYTSQFFRRFGPDQAQQATPQTSAAAITQAAMMGNAHAMAMATMTATAAAATKSKIGKRAGTRAMDAHASAMNTGWSAMSYDFGLGSGVGFGDASHSGMASEDNFGLGAYGMQGSNGIGPSMFVPPQLAVSRPAASIGAQPHVASNAPITMRIAGAMSAAGTTPMTGGIGGPVSNITAGMPITGGIGMPMSRGIAPQSSAAAARTTAGFVSRDMVAAASAAAAQGRPTGLNSNVKRKLRALIQLGTELNKRNVEAQVAQEPLSTPVLGSMPTTTPTSNGLPLNTGVISPISPETTTNALDIGGSMNPLSNQDPGISFNDRPQVPHEAGRTRSLTGRLTDKLFAQTWFKALPFYDSLSWFVYARRLYPEVASNIARTHRTAPVTLVVFLALGLLFQIAYQGTISDNSYFFLPHHWVWLGCYIVLLIAGFIRVCVHFGFASTKRARAKRKRKIKTAMKIKSTNQSRNVSVPLAPFTTCAPTSIVGSSGTVAYASSTSTSAPLSIANNIPPIMSTAFTVATAASRASSTVATIPQSTVTPSTAVHDTHASAISESNGTGNSVESEALHRTLTSADNMKRVVVGADNKVPADTEQPFPQDDTLELTAPAEEDIKKLTPLPARERFLLWAKRNDHTIQVFILCTVTFLVLIEQIILDAATTTSIGGYDDVCFENQRGTHWIMVAISFYVFTLSDLALGNAVLIGCGIILTWLVGLTLSWGIATATRDQDYAYVDYDGIRHVCAQPQTPVNAWVVDLFMLAFNILTRYRQESAMMRTYFSQARMQLNQQRTRLQSGALTRALRVVFPSHVFRLCLESEQESFQRRSIESFYLNIGAAANSSAFKKHAHISAAAESNDDASSPRLARISTSDSDGLENSTGLGRSKLQKLVSSPAFALQRRVEGLLIESVRGVTILVMNMIPLQSLAGLLQPTDLFAVFATLASVSDEAVELYGGKRARIVGNMFVAVFGLPHAPKENSDNASKTTDPHVADLGRAADPPGVRAGYSAFTKRFGPAPATNHTHHEYGVPRVDQSAADSVREHAAFQRFVVRQRCGLAYQQAYSAWSALSACNYIMRNLHELSKEFGVDIACSASLHTGPVLSGLLGSRAVRYDAYGPTVFQAEQMAQLVTRPRIIAFSDVTARALATACTWFGLIVRERWPLRAAGRDSAFQGDLPKSANGMASGKTPTANVVDWDPLIATALDHCAAIAMETIRLANVVLPYDVAMLQSTDDTHDTAIALSSLHSSGPRAGISAQDRAPAIPTCTQPPFDQLEPLLHFALTVVDEHAEMLSVCLVPGDEGATAVPTAASLSGARGVISQTSNYNDLLFATVSAGSQQILGLTHHQLVRQRLFDIVHPFDHSAVYSAIAALMACDSYGAPTESTAMRHDAVMLRRLYENSAETAHRSGALLVTPFEWNADSNVQNVVFEDMYRRITQWELSSWIAPVAICLQHRVVSTSSGGSSSLPGVGSTQSRWVSTTILRVGEGAFCILMRALSPELAAELASTAPSEEAHLAALKGHARHLYGSAAMSTSSGTLNARASALATVSESMERAVLEETNTTVSDSRNKRRGSRRSRRREDSPVRTNVEFSDFKLLQGLGAGQYATVYLSLHKPSANMFAIKRFNAVQVRSKSLQAELKALSARQRHPNVVDFVCCLTSKQEIWLVMEHVRGVPLEILLRQHGRLDPATVRFVLAEVLLGVGFLHSLGILHRDLAEKNIMINRDGHVKIIDFGLSVLVNPAEAPMQVLQSLNYQPQGASSETGSGPSGGTSIIDNASVGSRTPSHRSMTRSQDGSQPDSIGDTAQGHGNIAKDGLMSHESSNDSRQELNRSGSTASTHRRADASGETGITANPSPSFNMRALNRSNSKSVQSESSSQAYASAANILGKEGPFNANLVSLLQSLIPAPDNRVIRRLYARQNYQLKAAGVSVPQTNTPLNAPSSRKGRSSKTLSGVPTTVPEGRSVNSSNSHESSRKQHKRASLSTTVLLLTLDDGGEFVRYLSTLYTAAHAAQAGIPSQQVAQMTAQGAYPHVSVPQWLAPEAQRQEVASALRSKNVHLVRVATLAEAEGLLRRDAPIFDAFVVHCLGHPEMVFPALQMRYALAREIQAVAQLPAAVVFTAPAGEWQQFFAQQYAAHGAAMCIAMPFTTQSLRAVCLLARHTSEQREAALMRVQGLRQAANRNQGRLGAPFGSGSVRSGQDDGSGTPNSNFAATALRRMQRASTTEESSVFDSQTGGMMSTDFAGLMSDNLSRLKAKIRNPHHAGAAASTSFGGADMGVDGLANEGVSAALSIAQRHPSGIHEVSRVPTSTAQKLLQQVSGLGLGSSGVKSHPNTAFTESVSASLDSSDSRTSNPLLTGGTTEVKISANSNVQTSTNPARTYAETPRRPSNYFDYVRSSAGRTQSPFVAGQKNDRKSSMFKFGVANSVQQTVNTIAGTPHYMAPETLKRKTGLASDYFAVGVLAFRLLSGQYPFSGSSRRAVQENVLKNQVNWNRLPSDVPGEALSLLRGLLHPDPAHRLGGRDGVSEVMNHPFFAGVRFETINNELSPLAHVVSVLDPFAEDFDELRGASASGMHSAQLLEGNSANHVGPTSQTTLSSRGLSTSVSLSVTDNSASIDTTASPLIAGTNVGLENVGTATTIAGSVAMVAGGMMSGAANNVRDTAALSSRGFIPPCIPEASDHSSGGSSRHSHQSPLGRLDVSSTSQPTTSGFSSVTPTAASIQSEIANSLGMSRGQAMPSASGSASHNSEDSVSVQIPLVGTSTAGVTAPNVIMATPQASTGFSVGMSGYGPGGNSMYASSAAMDMATSHGQSAQRPPPVQGGRSTTSAQKSSDNPAGSFLTGYQAGYQAALEAARRELREAAGTSETSEADTATTTAAPVQTRSEPISQPSDYTPSDSTPELQQKQLREQQHRAAGPTTTPSFSQQQNLQPIQGFGLQPIQEKNTQTTLQNQQPFMQSPQHQGRGLDTAPAAFSSPQLQQQFPIGMGIQQQKQQLQPNQQSSGMLPQQQQFLQPHNSYQTPYGMPSLQGGMGQTPSSQALGMSSQSAMDSRMHLTPATSSGMPNYPTPSESSVGGGSAVEDMFGRGGYLAQPGVLAESYDSEADASASASVNDDGLTLQSNRSSRWGSNSAATPTASALGMNVALGAGMGMAGQSGSSTNSWWQSSSNRPNNSALLRSSTSGISQHVLEDNGRGHVRPPGQISTASMLSDMPPQQRGRGTMMLGGQAQNDQRFNQFAQLHSGVQGPLFSSGSVSGAPGRSGTGAGGLAPFELNALGRLPGYNNETTSSAQISGLPQLAPGLASGTYGGRSGTFANSTYASQFASSDIPELAHGPTMYAPMFGRAGDLPTSSNGLEIPMMPQSQVPVGSQNRGRRLGMPSGYSSYDMAGVSAARSGAMRSAMLSARTSGEASYTEEDMDNMQYGA